MKGRSSTVISIRLDDDILDLLKARARDVPVTEYIKKHLVLSVKPVNRSVNNSPPIYNKEIHKAGDRVLVRQGESLVEGIVPDLDADGRNIPD